MDILYTSGATTTATANQLLRETGENPGLQITRFSMLFLKGLVANGAKVNVLSNVRIFKGRFFFHQNEIEDGINFHYLLSTKIPLLRQLLLYVDTLIKTIHWIRYSNEEKIILCDIFSTTSSKACRLVAKMFHIPVCALVTDMIGYAGTAPSLKGKPWLQLLYKIRGPMQQNEIQHYDGYIFLTEYMNLVYNTSHKPYIIMEGLVEQDSLELSPITKSSPRIVLYAGAIEEIYGLKTLIEAFIKVPQLNVVLHIYGNGKFVQQLHQYERQDSRIHYMGLAPNSEIVRAEKEATLLVNPRFTGEEYTKFSFPSKTTEYMVSATPLLTTRLPGIPKNYFEYVYTFDDENVDGYANALNTTLSLSNNELQAKGYNARKFVLENKNNIVQSGRIIQLFNQLIGK